jgi:hypothetical protein
MKLFTFLALTTFCIVSAASAEEEVNLQDKTEKHIILNGNKKIGSIVVQSKFIGEPILQSTQLSVVVSCEVGYTVSKQAKKNTLETYDYGANGKLSDWNSKTKQLSVFHRTGVIEDGEPFIDKSMIWALDFSKACVKK